MSATHPQILVFQHIPVEHPGVFRDFLREDGVEWRAVELDAGESINREAASKPVGVIRPAPGLVKTAGV